MMMTDISKGLCSVYCPNERPLIELGENAGSVGSLGTFATHETSIEMDEHDEEQE